ncbi:hypothetical protein U2060_14925, partial [Listeria monocytogenes]|uniref:hypothetical protein n=1 Tax=Listeria monocytogenes TaxID=1639 RepID=UPI002FDBEE08
MNVEGDWCGEALHSEDEAKAAAQTHHDKLIRSALKPTPSYAEGRAAGLREAAAIAQNGGVVELPPYDLPLSVDYFWAGSAAARQ